jgi:hypothetical protein
MADDIKYTTYDEGESSPENEMKELRKIQEELKGAGDGLSGQALENAEERIEELKKDNPELK